jgi:hypothetical protein
MFIRGMLKVVVPLVAPQAVPAGLHWERVKGMLPATGAPCTR